LSWPQGLALARQAHYHLSYSTSPLCVGFIFKIGSHFMSRPTWMWDVILLFVLPRVAGMMGVNHCTQALVEMESHKPFAWAGLEQWSFRSLPPK
jgi:hypothetical protein